MPLLCVLLVSVLAACPAWAKGGEALQARPCAGAGLVQRLPEGQVDWGSGWVQVHGVSEGGRLACAAAQGEATKQAQGALRGLLRRLLVTSKLSVGNLLEANQAADNELGNLVRAAQIVDRKCYSDGSVEVAAALCLRGGFLQLVLPHEMTSIAAVRQVNGGEARPGSQYTGLIVDARGLGVRPALCPRLLCEDGSEVFGLSLVRRESAVQRGVAAYAAAMPAAGEGRCGPRPMLVKGLRASGPGRCDVVLSRAEAGRVRAAPESVEFLQRCSVLIVLD
jgi:hypothetical protein